MKKIISFLLAILMLFTLVSCNNDTGETSSTTAATTELSELVNTLDFKTGYSRVDITPTTFPIDMDGETQARNANENIYSTCVAVSDGEKQILLISIELIGLTESFESAIKSHIRNNLKIPKNQVFLFATHTHSAPQLNFISLTGSKTVSAWSQEIIKKIAAGATDAINDLAASEIYVEKTNTDMLNFVRRYRMADGSYKGIWSDNPSNNYIEHESVADSELQVIRFARNDAKDIVMANWQAHPAHAGSSSVSGDYISLFRKEVEGKHDVNFVYFNGAMGNIVLTSEIFPYKTYRQVGKILGEAVNAILDGEMEKVNAGKIQFTHKKITANVAPVDDATYQKASNVIRSENPDRAATASGFASRFEASAIVSRYNNAPSKDLEIAAISFGDISFACAPYEMFDTNGMEIKSASPFKMTFICSVYSGKSWGYIPSELAFSHGEYEVYRCLFVSGTGEQLANSFIDLLKEQNETK